MTISPRTGISILPSHVLGHKLDSIPFSAYHVVIILVLGFVGFIEGYDLALTGSLLVLAKGPLHMDADAVRALATWPTFLVVIGGFAAAGMSDRISRVAVMQVGVILSTLCTLLILFAHSFEQLFILRLITGFFLGFTISAPFPIAAELMPAQHRRTYAAIYETMLAMAFTLLPFVRFVLADHPRGFQLVGLPGGVTLFIAPVLICQAIRRPGGADNGQRPRNRARKIAGAVTAVLEVVRSRSIPVDCDWHSVWHLRRHRLLPDRDSVAESAGQSGRRRRTELRTELAGLRGQHSRKAVQRLHHGNYWPAMDDYRCVPVVDTRSVADGVGASCWISRDDCVQYRSADYRVHHSVDLPCRAHVPVRAVPDCIRRNFFGESFGRIFAGVLVPYVMVSHTASPTIFFGTMIVMVLIGACIPFALGRETLGNLETFTEVLPELA